MFGGLTRLERVDLDYVRARRRARFGAFRRLFGGGRGHLRDFDSARRSLRSYGTRRVGTREIDVDRIVGSVGRHRDFDESFMPKNGRLRQKWMRISHLYWNEEGFQPIRVYKIQDDYYVEDGNHRVSVAKFHGMVALDAEVTELVTRDFIGLRYSSAEKKGTRIV